MSSSETPKKQETVEIQLPSMDQAMAFQKAINHCKKMAIESKIIEIDLKKVRLTYAIAGDIWEYTYCFEVNWF